MKPTNRQLAETLAQAANIQPEPETTSLRDKIARVQADQARLGNPLADSPCPLRELLLAMCERSTLGTSDLA